MRLPLTCVIVLILFALGPAALDYVPMNYVGPARVVLNVEGKEGLVPIMQNIGRNMKEFVERMSRKKVLVTFTVNGPEQRIRLRFIPGASSRVPIIGNSITAKHELMHQFKLQHAHIRMWNGSALGKKIGSKDPFDVLTLSPGKPSLNAPHLHILKWFSPTEEAWVTRGQTYLLRVLNDGASEFRSLKSLLFRSQEGDNFFFSYVSLAGLSWGRQPGLPGTVLALHSTYANGYGTYLEALIGLGPWFHARSNLTIQLTDPGPKWVTVKIT